MVCSSVLSKVLKIRNRPSEKGTKEKHQQKTYFKLSAYIVSLGFEAPWGRTRNKYVPTLRFSNLADAVSRDIGPTNQ